MGVPATTGQLRTNVKDMQIGDYIPCSYQASSGALGSFSNLGLAIGNEIPISGTNAPDGYFYLIKVDKGILIADRVIQTLISWDALNSRKAIQGLGIGFGDVALLHFDNDFSDDMGNVWTPTGACEINSNLPPKFGAGCLHTPTGAYLTSSIDSIAFGSGDFTVDFWMYYKGGSWNGISSARIGGSMGFAIQPDMVWLGNGSTATKVSSSGFYVTNAWAHYALVRKDNMVYYFVNGVLKGSLLFANSIDETTIVINRRYSNSTSDAGDSYYDEIRISSFARWTSNFTPPTGAGTASGELYVIRSLTGGVAYADGNGNFSLTDQGHGGWPTNNEWDKYIVNFPANKIQAGKTLDDVFHHETTNVVTWCQDTPINGMTHPLSGGTPSPSTSGARVHRGLAKPTNQTNSANLAWAQSNWNTVWNGVLQGFRPVFEYEEA